MSKFKPPHKFKDNIYKKIFGDSQLFLEFLENFISIDILKNLTADSIEDITERFLPLFSDNKDSDTVKKISLDESEKLYVISIVEHESEVNYSSSFKMLNYISYVLLDYVKENDTKYKKEVKEQGKTKLKLSTWKEFKYPPVLPIVFYDGTDEWTSERNFFDKTDKNRIFEKYIPKFEYELVDLNDYSQRDLVAFNNALSLLLIVDKVKRPEDIKSFKELPEGFIESMAKTVPEPFLVIFRDCVELLLRKINVPKEEIERVTEKIYERRFSSMFDLMEGYDVQATRREVRREERKKALEEKLETARSLLSVLDAETIAEKFKMTVEEVEKLK